MKEKIKKLFYSDGFIVISGLVLVPLVSFTFINISPESPLYTSISRIAWVHGHWIATCLWALAVMSVIAWLTIRMIYTGPLPEKTKRVMILIQMINIVMVFIGCIVFPAKESPDSMVFFNYVHDYLTAIAWLFYVITFVVYSVLLRRKNSFLGFLGLGIMSFIILSGIFFLRSVIDPTSYVGASAVSEVYIINSLLIYLVVMYVLQSYAKRLGDERV